MTQTRPARESLARTAQDTRAPGPAPAPSHLSDPLEPAAVLVERQAHALLRRSGMTLEERREALLSRLAPTLGPAQWAHTTEHCVRVSAAAHAIAVLRRLAPAAIELARLGGLIHDLGKLAIPERVVAKPEPLSPLERATMGRHVDLGVRFAAALGASEDLQRVVAHHHTRFDADLIIADSAQDAVHAARVVCVADALVTMMSAREYSPARSMTEALSELRRHRGGMFDPAAVAAAHIYASSHVPAPAPLARAA